MIEKQIRKTFSKLFLMAVAGFCVSASLNGAGLDSFCGFKAGEERKAGKNDGQNPNRIEVKPKVRFRRFNKVGLGYSDGGRLVKVEALANPAGMKAAAAKKEFDECIKWFRRLGVHQKPGGNPWNAWSDDKGGEWCGTGHVKTGKSHLDVEVEIRASYHDPKMYAGDESGQSTGWHLYASVTWIGVDEDDEDLMPGAPPKRQRTQLKAFAEQTFRTTFKSACPNKCYAKIMSHKAEMPQGWRAPGCKNNEDANFANFLNSYLNITVSGKPLQPYIDVISPMGRVTLPGVRFAYGRYLTRPICHCDSVMFAYSNPKDKPGVKEPVESANDLALCALVLWGYAKDVKRDADAATRFNESIESWLGIRFAETNVTKRANVTTTVSAFREGNLTVTATAEVSIKSRIYFVNKRGYELKGDKLRELYRDFDSKVSAKMIAAPKSLSVKEREAMQKNLEKELFDSYGVKERFRETWPMKYHVVISEDRQELSE